MAAGPVVDRNQDATVYVGGLDEKVNHFYLLKWQFLKYVFLQVSEPILWELFVQAGPVVSVHCPKDRITNSHQVHDTADC